MSHNYQQQRWQLHNRLQEVKSVLHTLEQQLKEIDSELLDLDPEPDMIPIVSSSAPPPVSNGGYNQGTPLPIAAG